MRRIMFTILACTALSVAAPAVASAHDGQGNHHKRHHVRHEQFVGHRHARDFGNDMVAGTVTSFTNNVLTITLNNGNTVSGLVTDNTEVKCENPANNDPNGDNDVEQGDRIADHGPGGGGDNGGDSGNRGDDNGNRGDENNNDNMCTIAPGMGVRDASLRINGGGSFWDEVELVSSTTSTTPTTPTTPTDS
jgi:hypothetical protein